MEQLNQKRRIRHNSKHTFRPLPSNEYNANRITCTQTKRRRQEEVPEVQHRREHESKSQTHRESSRNTPSQHQQRQRLVKKGIENMLKEEAKDKWNKPQLSDRAE